MHTQFIDEKSVPFIYSKKLKFMSVHKNQQSFSFFIFLD